MASHARKTACAALHPKRLNVAKNPRKSMVAGLSTTMLQVMGAAVRQSNQRKRRAKVTRTLFPPHSERSGNVFWPPAFGTFPERPERGPPGDLEARARSRRGTVCTSQMNNNKFNKLISAASSYNRTLPNRPSRREGGSVSRHAGSPRTGRSSSPSPTAHQGFRKWGHDP